MAQMTATDLIAALYGRAAEIKEWNFNVEADIDQDGDGIVMLTVGYDESREGSVPGYHVENEPWDDFGPLADRFADSGMTNDDHGTVYQHLEFRVKNWMAV